MTSDDGLERVDTSVNTTEELNGILLRKGRWGGLEIPVNSDHIMSVLYTPGYPDSMQSIEELAKYEAKIGELTPEREWKSADIRRRAIASLNQ